MVPRAAMPHPPMQDLHAGAVCTSYRDSIGRRYPTLLAPTQYAASGRGAWGSSLMGVHGVLPAGAGAPVPAVHAVFTSATSR